MEEDSPSAVPYDGVKTVAWRFSTMSQMSLPPETCRLELDFNDEEGSISPAWSKAWSKADWGGAWEGGGSGSTYSVSRSRHRSVPLLPSAESTQPVTWYEGKKPVVSSTSGWKALGATWRDWDTEVRGVPENQVDEGNCWPQGKVYVNGIVPHWSKACRVRTSGVLEHELTWAYYRMQRHEGHPQRKAVGESLPNHSVGEKMRFGTGCTFKFWRDLRPPFAVKEVKRVDDGLSEHVPASVVTHPDGELHKISYECAIEYFAERLLDDDSEFGTFGNKVYGVAEVRIPNSWPQKRPINILSWGDPTLIPPDREGPPPPRSAPSSQQAGAALQPRAKSCIPGSRPKPKPKRKAVKVGDLNKLQLGKHVALERMPSMKKTADAFQEALEKASVASEPPAVAERRPRKHRVFTPACGFITYEG